MLLQKPNPVPTQTPSNPAATISASPLLNQIYNPSPPPQQEQDAWPLENVNPSMTMSSPIPIDTNSFIEGTSSAQNHLAAAATPAMLHVPTASSADPSSVAVPSDSALESSSSQTGPLSTHPHPIDAFTNRFIWSRAQLCAEPVHPWAFEEGMISDVQKAVSYAFLCAAQKPDNESTGCSDRAVTLLSPCHGGNVIIDVVVKMVAHKVNADVLVLDSLELAAGKFGSLEDGTFVDSLYDRLPIKDFEDMQDIQLFFNRLMLTGLESEMLGQNPPLHSSFRRLIYLRDFGAIAYNAMPLMIYLLRAIDNLRDSYPEPPAVAIVFGTSRPLGYAGMYGASRLGYRGLSSFPYGNTSYSSEHSELRTKNGFCIFTWHSRNFSVRRRSCDELDEGRIPKAVMPNIGDTVLTFNKLPLGNLQSTFFTPILTESLTDDEDDETGKPRDIEGEQCRHEVPVDDISLKEESEISQKGVKSEVDEAGRKIKNDQELKKGEGDVNYSSLPSWWEERVKALTSPNLCLVVYPENIGLEHQQSFLEERVLALNNILLKLLLAKKGVTVEGDIIAVSPNDLGLIKKENELEYSILLPSSADAIFEILAEQNGHLPSTAFTVSADQVSRAIQAWQKRLQRVEKWIHDENVFCPTAPKSKNGISSKPDPVVEEIRRDRGLTEHEEGLLSCIIDCDTLSTSFRDVCVDRKIIGSLRSIVSLPLLHPQQFRTGILSRESLSGVLLYGPPGTGKTMVCRALARESGARMLLVRPSDILNMWLGETEKYVEAVFKVAHRLAPCIIFIDEADALFHTRGTVHSGGHKVEQNMLTEFMQAMDGLISGSNGKDKGVVVIGATNRPYDLDQAILRRLPCRMLVDLPDRCLREDILKSHLKGETLQDIDFKDITARTESYSGSDLKNLCVAAAMEAVKDCIGGFDLETIGDNLTLVPHSRPSVKETAVIDADSAESSSPIANPSTGNKVNRVITMAHFNRALVKVTLSFSPEDRNQMDQWHRKYGYHF
ncbi:hypothetical protein VKT23_020429 [Stygiomarasmius scandens]|uniref:AAA+ ATPase domain-containing protein n=1 Tax=Marasmiellus scandens TaxID=2682957 RepID=A0ABR1IJ45_9AGAR